MTIKDVAKYCGVSVSTVSRVMNGHPDVSVSVRAKVLAAVSELHYVPNRSAQDLVRVRSDSIGVVVRGASNPFYSPIVRSIERVCEDKGYTMIVHHMGERGDEVKRGAELVNSKRLKGLILLGGRFDYGERERASVMVPFVCCAFSSQFGRLDGATYSSVSIDDAKEARRATRLLTDEGHRKIAILVDFVNDQSISELRYRGYRQALEEVGITLDEGLVLEAGGFSMAHAYSAVTRLLTARSDVTAIFSASDAMAMAAMKAVYDAGRRIPEDCSVVAIDGIEASRYAIPTLTTLEQPTEVMGRRAATTLIDQIEGRAGMRHVTLDAKIRRGGTLGPVPRMKEIPHHRDA